MSQTGNIGKIRPPSLKGVIRRFFDQDGAWFTYQTNDLSREVTYIFWTLLRRGAERLLAWIPATILMFVYLIVLGSNASPGIQNFSVAFSIIMGVLAVFVTTMLPRLPRAACVLTFQTFAVILLSIISIAATALMVSLELLPIGTRILWIVAVMLAGLYWFNSRSLKMADGGAAQGAFFDKLGQHDYD